jgi:hypothetical protein
VSGGRNGGGGTGALTFGIHHLSSRELLRTVIQK